MVATQATYTLTRVISELAGMHNSAELFSRFENVQGVLTARVPILGSMVAVRAVAQHDGYLIGAVGLNSIGTRWLHDVLVMNSLVTFHGEGREIQALAHGVQPKDLPVAVVEAAQLLLRLRAQEEQGGFPSETTVPMYWSSGVLNFGDWAGPHIAHALSGKQPVQGNRAGTGPRVLYTVGSILGWIKRNNVDIWGSGLMNPLSPAEIIERKKLTGIKIHAVRGRLTRKYLMDQLDWVVPEVYGDPALLLPDFLSGPEIKHGDISFVPHNIHRAKAPKRPEAARIVDVRRDVRDVVRDIAGSSAVISSSLHGLIVAQAYGVPWVWLDVTDQQLGGGEFKFEDFFSCLQRDKVSRVQVSREELATLDYKDLASKASLPSLTIDLQLLRDAFPIAPVARPLDFPLYSED